MLPVVARAEAPDRAPGPFAVRDLNPFILVYGLPPPEPAELAPASQTRTRIVFDLANGSMLRDGPSESIALDGESYRLALSVRRGFSDRLEAGIEIPFLFHSGGVLDGFIEAWHDLIGLPNDERDRTPDGTLDYSHRAQDLESIAVRSAQQGLGDVRLFAATTLFRAEDGRRTVSLHGSLELPTGDAARLLGSGSADLALSLGAVDRSLRSLRLTGWGRLGLLAIAGGDVLPDRRRPLVLFGGVGLGWRAGSRIDLEAQLDAHGSFYESELAQLGSRSIQLTLGGSVRLGRATDLDLAVGENLFTDTTPDFLVNVAITHRG
jgi:hypothetical protein